MTTMSVYLAPVLKDSVPGTKAVLRARAILNAHRIAALMVLVNAQYRQHAHMIPPHVHRAACRRIPVLSSLIDLNPTSAALKGRMVHTVITLVSV